MGATGATMHSIEQEIAANDALSEAEQRRYDAFRKQLGGVREQILSWKADGTLPLLGLPEQTEEVAAIKALAERIRSRAAGLAVLGTGGSSLGGQTLCALSDGAFPVRFLDNPDPCTTAAFLKREDFTDWHFLFISKSGGTLETLTQALVYLEALEAHNSRAALAEQCHMLTLPGARPLRDLAGHYAIPVLDHHPGIGGRYSVLSAVGLLPAAVAGVDIAAVREGAREAVAALETDERQAPSLTGAAWQAALMPTRPVSVLMPYCDRLKLFGAWYQQLWAESLGKNGLGSTPLAALGAVDQHSQLQLFLDGPKDKLFTLITLPLEGTGDAIPAAPFSGHDYLGGKRVGDVLAALQHGTVETLRRHGLPLRLLKLREAGAHSLGALLMHEMLETIAAAQLLGINAFDQPAVEESKQIARETLRRGLGAGKAA